MELVAPSVHRSLAYLVALDGQGYSPSTEELEEYATQPDHRPARRESVVLAGAYSVLTNLARSMERVVEPAESTTEHFLRLGWAATTRDGRLQATRLGRALVRALDQQSSEAGDVSDVVFTAGDPIALERVLARIASAGESLLVEPYFRIDVLIPVLYQTPVTRVLTTERTRPEERQALRSAVERMVVDRPFEIRVATREVHDRHLIPDAGPVQFIGSSLNSLGRVSTAMGTLTDGTDQIRALYEDLWESATHLARSQLGIGDAEAGEEAERSE